MIYPKNRILALIACLSWLCLTHAQTGEYFNRYDFDQPTQVISLTEELNEISGLGYDARSNVIYAVQDEKGKVYKLAASTGEIKDVIHFWKDGDYEGIEVVDDIIYIVKNSGTIFRVMHVGTDQQETIKFKTYLNSDDDVEGLGYDPFSGNLILSCKGFSYDKTDSFLERKIYQVNPLKLQLDTEAKIIVTKEKFMAFLDLQKESALVKLNAKMKKKEKEFKFNPSALAVHPMSGNIFVLSSKGKTLCVLDNEGTILHVKKLDKQIFCQPEGIIFTEKGDIFISNEAKEGQPNLVKIKLDK